MGLIIRSERQLKSLTGLSQDQFDYLLPCFSDIYLKTQQQIYEKGMEFGTRIRKPGGGAKGKLPTMSDKLIFILFYYKTYPTFDVLGSQFDMARSKAHVNIHKLSPILYDTLVSLELMPYRRFETPEDLKDALNGLDQVIIDATERAYRRSNDGTVRLWNRQGEAIAKPFEGHSWGVLSVAISKDGHTIVSGGYDGTMWLWHIGVETALMKTCHLLHDHSVLRKPETDSAKKARKTCEPIWEQSINQR